MANEKAKNILVGVLCASSVTVFGLWQFGMLEAPYFNTPEESNLTVPDGYVHTGTKQADNEVVHTYEKQAPKEVLPTQTSDVAYQRYLESLPSRLDKAIGQEFRTLSVSLQNAQLYADTTGLVRQGRENLKELNDIAHKEKAANKAEALNKMNTGLVVDVSTKKSELTEERDATDSSLSAINLEGVVGGNGSSYVIFTDGNGRRFNVREGQKFGDRFVLKKITENSVIVSNGQSKRSMPRM